MRDWTSKGDGELRRRIESDLPALMSLARRLASDDELAQDAVQDALERAWRSREQLRDPQATSTWLRRILSRTIVDLYRSRREFPAAQTDPAAEQLPDVDDPDAIISAAEREATLRAALRSLSVADRVAVVLHDGEEWSAIEIAAVFGTSTEAAYKRIQRARPRLIAALAADSTAVRQPGVDCRDTRAHAHRLLDGSLDESERATIQEHLDTCNACPGALQAAAGVLQQLSAPTAAPMSPELRNRLRLLMTTDDSAG